MSKTDELLGLLGLASRARGLVSGDDICMRHIRARTAYYVILTTDAGKNGAKKIQDKCRFYGIPFSVVLARDVLGSAIGKEERTVVAITDEKFANKINELVEQIVGGVDI
ncbi:L7Ae/L30e/S12e/Gadd45 family ribosomal protein [Sulfoacidibacillus ferrooxidans]|uniref:Ribosomal protein YlxQ n=1 Tax=Sulfoacidibacillus ferrooxidans TaxID=2005001 RepID=A0A9X2AF25_9BACL|nr:ribosomal L7Ae/L30e/S12e/Gadd45 family protein [Sulfoacidibacillus ferrooxidans]MCI0183626.1 putative ribosomal protein YlxQ [Sulfoacidibacillus ferrooxidans]